MRKTLTCLAALAFTALTGFSAYAADAPVTVRKAKRVAASGYGCALGYACYPLYGAYGPWGGRDYWGAYSFHVDRSWAASGGVVSSKY
jgi:hypothetical protein